MRIALLVGLALVFSFGGCTCSRKPPKVEPLSKEELASIPEITPPQLQALLAKHKGKVVVLVVWSVRHNGCVAMYPKLNGLAGGAEPVVIAVSIDRVDDVRSKVIPMLEEQKPKFINHVVRGGADPLASFVGMDWSGGRVPAIVVYRRDGARDKAFYGDAALDTARRRVKQLLGE